MRQLSFIAFVLFLSCKNGGNSKTIQPHSLASTISTPLPNTPETVVKTWEEKINTNDYKTAKMLCTESAWDFVNSLDISQQESKEPIEVARFSFEKIKCSEKGNSATCDCILKYEDSGRAFFQYLLTNQKGQWLISRVQPVESVSMEIKL